MWVVSGFVSACGIQPFVVCNKATYVQTAQNTLFSDVVIRIVRRVENDATMQKEPALLHNSYWPHSQPESAQIITPIPHFEGDSELKKPFVTHYR